MKWPVSDWTFKNGDDEQWLPAVVPGCIHTDLLRNGLIPEPFVGMNEKQLQWIDKRDWEYATAFDVSKELFGQSKLELVFEGLDTYADVYLNERLILQADNMFRIWTVDVKPHLLASGNRLRIRFRSPIQEGLAKLEQLGYGLPASNDDSKTGELEDKKVSVFTRKAPYHFGWDWGPRFVTSGICSPVYLQGWSGVRIKDLFIRQDDVTEAQARVTAVLEIEAEQAGAYELRLDAADQQWQRTVTLKPGAQTMEWTILIEHPRLWWSRGLGEQHQYDFEASLMQDAEVAAQLSVRTGLRSVKLIRRPDGHGSTFYFEVNGVPVFAKGANHIPNDSFANEVTAERYRHEIASAAESNFTMLRVWGGGFYEQRAFYELCDEYGILVWQDFMFACSMYPGDEPFLNSVKAEAIDNIRRLRNHPSIALWCGNNEIDAAWGNYDENAGWGWKKQYTAEQREEIWAAYEAVFHRILPEAVAELAPDIAYWPSSPMQALTNDGNQHATNNSAHGDIHYWAVWHASEPFEHYNDNIGRFMSEYGFQSFPEHKTVRTYAEENEMALDSDVMLHHQKNGRGNFLIKEYSEKYMKDPKDFQSFLYMSQVLQAEGMKTAIEAHRRKMDFCMGTLYWQMNDCWPVASWSSMDYLGRWKAVQYYVKRSFSDVLLSIYQHGDRIEFHLVSDKQQAIEGTLSWSLYDFAGKLLAEESQAASIAPNAAAAVLTLSAGGQFSAYDPNRTVLVAQFAGSDGEVIDRADHYFAYSKALALEEPGVAIETAEGSEGTAFVLTARSLAKQVWLQSEEEGIFSDNFFDLVPGIPVTVRFSKRNADGQAFAPASPGRLAVQSMYDFAGAAISSKAE
ncbi:glycoside hydrolase family 2 protein [Paenibacillus rhizovicinus]|uniref:Beta-mannosidase n=1 Tax=Paenibacillus rhizovicinus TaxID=2704463 RepID=A0A6C0P912_9BACL|nr:glycoside hydrolase family 2 protein [Paenibacillus rhizovicinus]QHW35044.1 glycoside hydrolase family 2 protein [Paenibacillus rhizovicinus]